MASFGLYNALIGYLLVHREDPGLVNLLLFAIAMSLHFIVLKEELPEDRESCFWAFALGAGGYSALLIAL